MTETRTIHWPEANARRLERHGLSRPLVNATPAEIVRAMCGAHAQIMSAAELSVALRSRDMTQADIRTALWVDHSLVKTYGPRGTVHLLPTQDLPMWCGALAATPYGRSADRANELLTPDQAEAIIAAIADALAGAELTTDELTAVLVERLGAWAGEPVMEAFQGLWPRWRMVQSTAGVRGALCFGHNRGRNVTYTNPGRWLPGFKPAGEREALAELVKRYLYAYGPATPGQFARWLAVPNGWASQLFDSLRAELIQVDFEGSPAWIAAGDPFSMDPTGETRGVRLLPYFDAFGVGSFPREKLFPGRAFVRALAGGQAGNYPLLLVDGIVAGVWHLRRSGKTIDLTVEPLDDLSTGQRQLLDDQARRIGEITGGKPQLTIGPVSTGPHA